MSQPANISFLFDLLRLTDALRASSPQPCGLQACSSMEGGGQVLLVAHSSRFPPLVAGALLQDVRAVTVLSSLRLRDKNRPFDPHEATVRPIMERRHDFPLLTLPARDGPSSSSSECIESQIDHERPLRDEQHRNQHQIHSFSPLSSRLMAFSVLLKTLYTFEIISDNSFEQHGCQE